MKRFHIHYAKWMLEDPRINFAISTRTNEVGVDHLGLQVESDLELAEITERLKKADLGVFDEGETTCCYAESNKAWTKDPAGLAWEAYHTMNDAEIFGSKEEEPSEEQDCCVAEDSQSACC
jgi:hypothetical protein